MKGECPGMNLSGSIQPICFDPPRPCTLRPPKLQLRRSAPLCLYALRSTLYAFLSLLPAPRSLLYALCSTLTWQHRKDGVNSEILLKHILYHHPLLIPVFAYPVRYGGFIFNLNHPVSKRPVFGIGTF